jgi:hypothetical protein
MIQAQSRNKVFVKYTEAAKKTVDTGIISYGHDLYITIINKYNYLLFMYFL